MIRFEEMYKVNFNWHASTVLTIWVEGGYVQMEAGEAVFVYGDRLVVTVMNTCVDLSDRRTDETESTLYDVFMTNMEWERCTKLKIYDGENSSAMAVNEMPAALMLKKVIAFYGCEVELAEEEVEE